MSDEKTIIADSFSATIFSPQNRAKACLVQYSGTNLGKRFVLEDVENIAGRLQSVLIHINDSSVSRQHAKFVEKDGDVEVSDMGSMNGTFVNEKKLERAHVLHDGDMVRLGTVLFKFFGQGNIENVFHDKIYRMATIDVTTQIFNKKYLLESLESEFRMSSTYNRWLSIIVYDLDFFKKVNDQHGHNAGDFILKESCQLVKAAIRKQDILGRFGGEEFVIVLPETDARIAFDLAERIRKIVEGHEFKIDGKILRQTISMGVAQYKPGIPNAQALIEEADKKLYHSKHSGRNRVTV